MTNTVRAALPPQLHQKLKHLALDLKRPVQELLVDAAILLLRYHERGAGLPEPDPPNAPAPKPRPAMKGGVR